MNKLERDVSFHSLKKPKVLRRFCNEKMFDTGF